MKRISLILAIILLIGITLRIYFLLNIGFLNLPDEIGTLIESQNIFKVIHSGGYFFLLNLWRNVSKADVWLRYFSLLWGIGVIFLGYLLGKEITNKFMGLALAFSLALSPVAIFYSLHVRFYSYFLFWAMFSLYLFFRWINEEKKNTLIYLILANIFLLTSHLFGFLLIYLQIIFILITRKNRRCKIFSIIMLIIPLVMIFLFYKFDKINNFFWLVLAKLHGVKNPYDSMKGLSVKELRKVVPIWYNLLFGYNIYPLNFLRIVFSFFLFIFFCSGLRYFFHCDKKKFWFIILVFIYITILSLGTGIISPVSHAGFHQRYVIYFLPLILIVLLFNIQSRHLFFKYGNLIFIVASFILGLWYDSSYYKKNLNLEKVLENNLKINNLLIFDRGSNVLLSYYFKHVEKKAIDSLTLDTDRFRKIFVMLNEWEPEIVDKYNIILRQNFSYYLPATLYYAYPRVIFQLEKKIQKENIIPIQYIPIEFQDVELPIKLKYSNKEYILNNPLTFRLVNNKFLYNFGEFQKIKQFVLFSTITNLSINKIKFGDSVGRIKFIKNGKEIYSFDLHYGLDTGGWMDKRADLLVAYEWHKKIAFIGRWGYREKYVDTRAKIFFKVIKFQDTLDFDSVELSSLKDDISLHIWGLFLEG